MTTATTRTGVGPNASRAHVKRPMSGGGFCSLCHSELGCYPARLLPSSVATQPTVWSEASDEGTTFVTSSHMAHMVHVANALR
jgi:hypothetical protein